MIPSLHFTFAAIWGMKIPLHKHIRTIEETLENQSHLESLKDFLAIKSYWENSLSLSGLLTIWTELTMRLFAMESTFERA